MQRVLKNLAGLLLAIALIVPAILAPTALAAQPNFPKIIELPNGWRPEGIASGRGTTFYVGSLANGAVYQGDFRTGEGAILIPGQAGIATTGLYLDQRTNYLFAAGAFTGQGRVYDATTGTLLRTYQFQLPPTDTFINDVVVTPDAAYFTDSFQALLYKVPLNEDGTLAAVVHRVIPLSGDFVFIPGGFNANGIEATPDGAWLVIVNSTTGDLFRVDPNSGEANSINTGGASFTSGDGLRFAGQYLYVVRNQLNQIAEVRLNADLTRGTVNRIITDSEFDVPTTLASFGDSLYAVNARFTTPPTPDTEYQVVRVVRHP